MDMSLALIYDTMQRLGYTAAQPDFLNHGTTLYFKKRRMHSKTVLNSGKSIISFNKVDAVVCFHKHRDITKQQIGYYWAYIASADQSDFAVMLSITDKFFSQEFDEISKSLSKTYKYLD